MNFLSNIKKIKFNKDNFIKHYVKYNTPVILKGAIDHWEALHKWNADYLKKSFKNISIKYRFSNSIYHPDFYHLASSKIIDSTLEEFFKNLETKTKTKDTYFLSGEFFNLFLQNKIQKELDILWSDFCIPEFINSTQLELIGLWLSSKRIISWLHYDGNGAHNFNAQIKGQKSVILISPDQAKLCYINPYSNADFFNFSKVDVKKPDYDMFPKFKNVSYYKATLNAGEALYIPPFWLHSFEHLDTYNLNLNFWWHDSNVQLSPLALRGHFLYTLRNVLRNNDKILSRQQLIDKLKNMREIKNLIDKMDSLFLDVE